VRGCSTRAREAASGVDTIGKLDAFDRAQRIDAVVAGQIPDLESTGGRADGIIRVRTRVDDSIRSRTAVERVAAGTACDDIVAAGAQDRIVAGAAQDTLDAAQRGRGQVDRAAVAGELQDIEAVAAVDDLDVDEAAHAEHIVASGAEQRVGGGSAVDRVVTGAGAASLDFVVAGTARN
jgi:hypothetical protein